MAMLMNYRELSEHGQKKKKELLELAEQKGIPDRTARAIVDHVLLGTGGQHGDFIGAVLSNNLSNSFGRADLENRAALHKTVKYLYNYCPAKCWGSKEKMQDWPGLENLD